MKYFIAIFSAALLILALAITPAPVQAAACGSTYIVQLGDTLSGIAAGCGVSYANLLQANPGISNPNIIYVGQSINIPSGVPVTGGSTYTVQAGDTLYNIAVRSGVTLSQLEAANPNLSNYSLIYPGQVINLPQGAGVPVTGGSTYTVQAGDTLFGIANAHNTNVPVLMALNPFIVNSNLIYVGEVITLP